MNIIDNYLDFDNKYSIDPSIYYYYIICKKNISKYNINIRKKKYINKLKIINEEQIIYKKNNLLLNNFII